MDKPPRNKMMQAAPNKKEFHFSGDGIWQNATMYADSIEEATKLWFERRQPVTATASTTLSTSTAQSSTKEGI